MLPVDLLGKGDGEVARARIVSCGGIVVFHERVRKVEAQKVRIDVHGQQSIVDVDLYVHSLYNVRRSGAPTLLYTYTDRGAVN